jgi:hypothetical protein
MRTDEVDVASEIQMTMTRVTAALALLTAATACASERVVASKPSAPAFATALTTMAPQVPLLFVVDGVRYQRDQVPQLTADQILAVRVIKGHAALKEYGQDASYGVVVITTRQAAAPRS